MEPHTIAKCDKCLCFECTGCHHPASQHVCEVTQYARTHAHPMKSNTTYKCAACKRVLFRTCEWYKDWEQWKLEHQPRKKSRKTEERESLQSWNNIMTSLASRE